MSDYSFYNYTDDDKTIENTYSFLNADLYYQKGDSPWEFSVGASNLTNTKSLNQDNFNENNNTTNTSQYFVQPRYMMFKVKFDL